jgi:hypothetical protein
LTPPGRLDLRLVAGYMTLIGVGCAWILFRNANIHATQLGTREPKKKMTTTTTPDTDWQTKPGDVNVTAKPSGLWTLAYEYVRGPVLIRFSAEPGKRWNYAARSACTADGDLSSMISSHACVLPGAPVGALIGKIGGSSAGQADGKVFLVGSFAIIEIDANTRGPLYLTINDEIAGMDNNSGDLKVNIRIKKLPEPKPSAQASAEQKPPAPAAAEPKSPAPAPEPESPVPAPAAPDPANPERPGRH